MTSSLPPGPFQLILADPPWATTLWAGQDRTPTQKRGEDHYPVMTREQLVTLPVEACAAPHALLAMWTIGSHLDQAMALGQAWGFRYSTDLFYWAKQRQLRPDQIDLFTGDIHPAKLGLGKHSRKQVEPCLLFARGKGLKVLDHSVRQLIVAPAREHSRKPEQAFTGLDALYGTQLTRLELFSRTPRAGWTSWGNETGKFEEERA